MPKIALKVAKPRAKKFDEVYMDVLGERPEYAKDDFPEIRWNNFDAIPAPLPDPIVIEDPLPKPKTRVKKSLDHREMCVTLFKKPLTQVSRWVIGSTKAGYKEYPAEICHAQFHGVPDDVSLFASNFGGQPDMEEADEAYWQFMIGPLSPWRCLFEHGVPEKLFYKNGRQSGFIMNNIDIVDEKKTTLLYNFCIAMRMGHEYPGTIKAWHHFVKLGLDGIEALYLCRMFEPIEKYDGVLIKRFANDGCHWPLAYHQADYGGRSGYINFDRLYEGRPAFEGRSCGQWCDPVKRGYHPTDFNTKMPLKMVMRGVFCKVQGIPEDELIVEYREWMKNYRKKMNEKEKE